MSFFLVIYIWHGAGVFLLRSDPRTFPVFLLTSSYILYYPNLLHKAPRISIEPPYVMLSLKWSPSNDLSDFLGQSFPVKVNRGICNDGSVQFGWENNYKQIPKISGLLRCLQLTWLSIFPGLISGPSMQGVLIMGIC